ncbi:MAG: hypothetical protein INQ03_07770 [Candidatus Heimdallarchaeota archaeon]|nr:hypothetical protein [Candidatus Heimdallarchaeota archaeon]
MNLDEVQKIFELIVLEAKILNEPRITMDFLEYNYIHQSKSLRFSTKQGEMKPTVNHLPSNLFSLTHLHHLDLSFQNLTEIPEDICRLNNLKSLNLNNNPLQSLPESIGQLKQLKFLYLNRTKLTSLPQSITKLRNIREATMENTIISLSPEQELWIKELEDDGALVSFLRTPKRDVEIRYLDDLVMRFRRKKE